MGITVEGPSGQKLEFPDGTPDEVVRSEADKFFTSQQTGGLESFGRGLVEGATFGFDGRIGGEGWKAAREKSRKDNPWTHFAGEVAGNVAAPLVVFGTGGGGALAAGAVAARGAGVLTAPGAQAVVQGSRAVGQLLNPAASATYAGAAAAGARAGAAGGALSGLGHSEQTDPNETGVGSVARQVKDAALGGVVGAAGGAAIGPLVHGATRLVQRGAQVNNEALADAGNAEAGALRQMERALERDNISPADLERSVRETSMPDVSGARFGRGGASQWDDALMDRVVDLYHQNPNASARDIGRLLAADPAMQGRALPGQPALKSFLGRMAEFDAPLNLVDRAGMQRAGSGENTQWMLRAASNTPGPARAQAREALVSRQMGGEGSTSAGDRLTGTIERIVGDGNGLEQARDAARGRVLAASERAYDQAFADEAKAPRDLSQVLDPIVRQRTAEADNFRGPRPEGVRKAVDSLYRNEPMLPEQLSERVRVANNPNAPPIRESGPVAQDMPAEERVSLFRQWQWATKRIPQPEGLSDFVARYVGRRGILDPGGDIPALGDRRLGKMSSKDNGVSLDDIALAAQDHGFIRPTEGGRVTIRELLDTLDEDLRGNRVVREADFDAMEDIRQQQNLLRDLYDVGVSGRTRQEVMEQLGLASGPGNTATTQATLPKNLRQFMDARQNLRQISDTERNSIPRRPDGSDGDPTPLLRDLTSINQEMTDAVGEAYPSWRFANNLWRDGKVAQEALDDGQRLALNLNQTSRAVLDQYDGLLQRVAGRKTRNPTPQQAIEIEAAEGAVSLFRVGFARSLMDRLVNNKGETTNLVREFRKPAARQIVERVLGRKDAVRFLRAVEAEDAMHRTYASQFGSQTSPLKAAMEDQSWAPRHLAGMNWLNPKAWLDTAMEHMAARFNSARNEALMPMLTNTNPAAQIRTLRQVQALGQVRENVQNSAGASAARRLPQAQVDAFQGEVNERRRERR